MITIEIKAQCADHDRIREELKARSADFDGKDDQVDTYFEISHLGHGRLKLREGAIENSLIYYEREDIKGPKKSAVILHKKPTPSLKEILSRALGILVVVDKEREIYRIDNIKFHIDVVKNLGFFIEIEATDEDGTIGEARLLAQCNEFLDLFKISEEQLVSESYSDLLLRQRGVADTP